MSLDIKINTIPRVNVLYTNLSFLEWNFNRNFFLIHSTGICYSKCSTLIIYLHKYPWSFLLFELLFQLFFQISVLFKHVYLNYFLMNTMTALNLFSVFFFFQILVLYNYIQQSYDWQIVSCTLLVIFSFAIFWWILQTNKQLAYSLWLEKIYIRIYELKTHFIS